MLLLTPTPVPTAATTAVQDSAVSHVRGTNSSCSFSSTVLRAVFVQENDVLHHSFLYQQVPKSAADLMKHFG